MEQEVLKALSSGKSLDKYKKVLHLLNAEDCGEYEETNNRSQKKFLGWGRLYKKNKSVFIITQEGRGMQ